MLKVLLQGHVALKTHGLAARARLASTENVFTEPAQNYNFSEEALECYHGDFRAERRTQACFLTIIIVYRRVF